MISTIVAVALESFPISSRLGRSPALISSYQWGNRGVPRSSILDLGVSSVILLTDKAWPLARQVSSYQAGIASSI